MKPHFLLIAICLAGTLVPMPLARSAPSSTQITIIDYAFEPAEQTITAGASITWQNNGQELHNVFDLGGAWASPALNPGQTYTLTLTAPGTYLYVCSIHSGMLGTIIVAAPPQRKLYIATIQR